MGSRRGKQFGRSGGFAAVLSIVLAWVGVAGAESRPPPQISAQIIAPLSPEAAERLWLEAVTLERESVLRGRGEVEAAVARFDRAGTLFQVLSVHHRDYPAAFWRAGRSYWLAGEVLPVEETERRLDYYRLAKEMVVLGLAVDPDCAECMLWKFIAMGRIRTAAGGWGSMSDLREMAALLDRGIELAPKTPEDENNSTLGNLHYSSAIYYRVFPDWFWLGWLIGVKGDKERAYTHAQKALAIHPNRLDYRIELGAQLLCLGTVKADLERLERGKSAMRTAQQYEPGSEYERRELAAVRIMLNHPEKACGYSGDTWIEIDKDEAKQAARGG